MLAMETGMRIGELCGIQWQDIDFEKKILFKEIETEEQYRDMVLCR